MALCAVGGGRASLEERWDGVEDDARPFLIGVVGERGRRYEMGGLFPHIYSMQHASKQRKGSI